MTASAWAGVIDTGVGAAPWTMHIDAFNPDGTPKYTKDNPIDFGTQCGDVPDSGTDMSWTDFNGADNVNSSEVKDILDGSHIVTSTMGFGQYLGQHNNGCHTTLWGDTDQHLAGKNVPVPIVGDPVAPATTCAGSSYRHGCFKGWAMFHVISASGGSDKVINGYFLENFRTKPLTVGDCTPTQEAAGHVRADHHHEPLRQLRGEAQRLSATTGPATGRKRRQCVHWGHQGPPGPD